MRLTTFSKPATRPPFQVRTPKSPRPPLGCCVGRVCRWGSKRLPGSPPRVGDDLRGLGGWGEHPPRGPGGKVWAPLCCALLWPLWVPRVLFETYNLFSRWSNHRGSPREVFACRVHPTRLPSRPFQPDWPLWCRCSLTCRCTPAQQCTRPQVNDLFCSSPSVFVGKWQEKKGKESLMISYRLVLKEYGNHKTSWIGYKNKPRNT